MSWLSGAGALLSGVGGLAGSGASIYGATEDDKLKTQTQQAPGWSRGLQNMFARAIAQNAFNVAPSFGDYVSSGGTAAFPTNFTGLSPQEERLLGFVGNAGEPLPFTGNQRFGEQPPSELSPDQRLYLAQQDLKSGRKGPLRNLGKKLQRYQSLEAKAADPYISDQRRARLEGKLTRTGAKGQDLYDSIMRRGHGTGDLYAGDPQYDVPKRAPGTGVRQATKRETSSNSRYNKKRRAAQDDWRDKPGPWKGFPGTRS